LTINDLPNGSIHILTYTSPRCHTYTYLYVSQMSYIYLLIRLTDVIHILTYTSRRCHPYTYLYVSQMSYIDLLIRLTDVIHILTYTSRRCHTYTYLYVSQMSSRLKVPLCGSVSCVSILTEMRFYFKYRNQLQ